MKVALYARVSTIEQESDMQTFALNKYCKEHDYAVTDIYKDKKTGRNEKRPEYQRMLKDALYRKFDTLLVWKMDRLSRGKIVEVFNILEKLKGYGITVVSITEPYLSTDNPSADLILAIMAWAANMESKRIGERVTAGIKNWSKEHSGQRWHGKSWNIEKAIELRQQGLGWRSIEKEMRKDGYDITWAGIRAELLRRGINKPSQNSLDSKSEKTEV